MAAMKTLFDHLIVPINPNAMMTTYVSSSHSLSFVMFSHILAQMLRYSPQSVEQSNPAGLVMMMTLIEVGTRAAANDKHIDIFMCIQNEPTPVIS